LRRHCAARRQRLTKIITNSASPGCAVHMRAEADGGLTVCAARRASEASFCCGQFARELRCPSCNGQRTAPRAVNQPHWAFLLARVRHRCKLPLVAALFAAFAEWLSQLFFSAALVGRCFSAAACSRFIGRFRWLLSPAAAVGRFHWPLSLATYWPLHSAVLVGPPTQPARRNSISLLTCDAALLDNTFAEERKEHGTCIRRPKAFGRQSRPARLGGVPAKSTRTITVQVAVARLHDERLAGQHRCRRNRAAVGLHARD